MSITLKDSRVIALGTLAGIIGGVFSAHWSGTAQEQAAVVKPATNRVPAARLAGTPSMHQTSPFESAVPLRAQEKPSMAPAARPAPLPIQSTDNFGALSAAEYQHHRAEALSQWNLRLQQHATEPVDPKWSVSTGNAFAVDLGQIAEAQSFRVVATQCRTQTCSATVEWPDYDTATSKYSALLYQNTRANCAKEIVLPEPANRTAAYQATILYKCDKL